MIKMPRCRRGKNVVGLREGGVHHKHDPRGARLQPSLPALLSGNLDSGHSGVFFRDPEWTVTARGLRAVRIGLGREGRREPTVRVAKRRGLPRLPTAIQR